MRFLVTAALLAVVSAFTTQQPGLAHRTRQATVVYDGKANGEFRLLRVVVVDSTKNDL
jgi:hypothetical protein